MIRGRLKEHVSSLYLYFAINRVSIASELGGKQDDGKPQPIVAKFLRYHNKEYIRKSAYLLKGTKIEIADQFLKEIADARKKRYPVTKKVKMKETL